MITYRATLDVPAHTLTVVTRWITAHRRARDIRPWQRAATARTQALLVLRWFKDVTRVDIRAIDAGISVATAYRYLHEAIDIIAERAPDLHDVLATAKVQAWPFLALDAGPDRPAARTTQPDRRRVVVLRQAPPPGANIQVLCDPTGYPVWVSPASPGSTHDITAARRFVLPALYRAAAAGIPTLTDKGYQGAGIGIRHPRRLTAAAHVDDLARDRILISLRATAERGNTLLKHSWRALRLTTLDPSRTTEITAAALVLLHLQRGTARSAW
ncbi:MAG: family transposase [Oerskovia sp.]|nr:family transposase [Oerskovia sp.]